MFRRAFVLSMLLAATAMVTIANSRRHQRQATVLPQATERADSTTPAQLAPPQQQVPSDVPQVAMGPKLIGRTEEIPVKDQAPMRLPIGYVRAASRLLADGPTGRVAQIITPSDPEVLRLAAMEVVIRNFEEKDDMKTLRAYLSGLTQQAYPTIFERGPLGLPIPVSAAQLWTPSDKPSSSVTDAVRVWRPDIVSHAAMHGVRLPTLGEDDSPEADLAAMAYICSQTLAPDASPLVNLLTPAGYRHALGIESIATWASYRHLRIPYADLLNAVTIQYAVWRGDIDYLTTILDKRKGEAYTAIQKRLGFTFNRYGGVFNGRVYWAEGKWAHLSGQTVPVDDQDQPLNPRGVPNYSEPYVAFLRAWLERLRTGTAREQTIYNRLLGDGLYKYCNFDQRFRPLRPIST